MQKKWKANFLFWLNLSIQRVFIVLNFHRSHGEIKSSRRSKQTHWQTGFIEELRHPNSFFFLFFYTIFVSCSGQKQQMIVCFFFVIIKTFAFCVVCIATIRACTPAVQSRTRPPSSLFGTNLNHTHSLCLSRTHTHTNWEFKGRPAAGRFRGCLKRFTRLL